MKRFLAFFGMMFSLALMACAMTPAFAQTAANPDTDFLTQLIQFIQQYGSMSLALKVTGGVLLILALIKTSFIAPLYAKLPDLVKTMLAPVLGLVGALISQGGSLTWASAFAFVTAGAGAVFLHEILDGVKAIPGLGSIYITIIGLAEAILFKPVSLRDVEAQKLAEAKK